MADNKLRQEDMKGFKRFKTFNSLNGSEYEEYVEPVTEPGEYIVDDSSFIPMEEAIKQLKGSGMTAEEIAQTYDFPNGTDSGIEVPLNRRVDIKDIAEISHEIMQQVDSLSEKVSEEKKFQQKQKALSENIQQIRNNNKESE